MPKLNKCIYKEDLIAVSSFSLLSIIFVLIPPFNETFLRIPIALSLFFFIPGYAFIAALFPGNGEISGIERFTLSVGFSLILTVFDGFLISLLPWGYRPAPIVISILGITVFFSIVAIITRKRRKESEQFSFSIKEFIRELQTDGTEENKTASKDTSPLTENRRFQKSRSKVKVKALKHKPDTEIKQALPPEIEKALVIALIGSIIVSSAMLAYAKITREKETFTMLYLLGPNGKAEGYPSESFIDVPITVTVGIDNHELQNVNYTLQMKMDGTVIEELNIPIKDQDSWQKNMTYTRQKLKNGRSKLEFSLFKGEAGYYPYRSVHLYIENNNSFAHLYEQKYADITYLPKIENGDMESSSAWNFTSNTENITGSYINGSGVDSSRAYRIINSYNGNLSSFEPHFGEISQNIECKENMVAVLSVFVKNNFTSESPNGIETQFKKIVVNEETVWEDGISEDEKGQHLEIPVSLKADKNKLSFGLKQTRGSEVQPVEVLWDNISLKPLKDLSPYKSEDNTIETIPPSSKVLELPEYTNNKTVTVRWEGADEISGIAYYSIEYSVDGLNWRPWISKIRGNSSTFTGKIGQTYYFRSKAVDNAGNEESEHAEPDTEITLYDDKPVISLDMTPNPCKDAARFTVQSSLPLHSATCLVTLEEFKGTDYVDIIEMKSSDGFEWAGNCIVKHTDTAYVEAVCTDVFGNTVSTFGVLEVDNSILDFEIEISPKRIDKGELEIKVTPSTVLKRKPSISISSNEKIKIEYIEFLEGDYYYTAKITSKINEGAHKVTVTGYTLESEKITGESSFEVDHPD